MALTGRKLREKRKHRAAFRIGLGTTLHFITTKYPQRRPLERFPLKAVKVSKLVPDGPGAHTMGRRSIQRRSGLFTRSWIEMLQFKPQSWTFKPESRRRSRSRFVIRAGRQTAGSWRAGILSATSRSVPRTGVSVGLSRRTDSHQNGYSGTLGFTSTAKEPWDNPPGVVDLSRWQR